MGWRNLDGLARVPIAGGAANLVLAAVLARVFMVGAVGDACCWLWERCFFLRAVTGICAREMTGKFADTSCLANARVKRWFSCTTVSTLGSGVFD